MVIVGVASNARNRTTSVFVPSVSFCVKRPYVIFSIFNFTLPSNVTFQNVDFLEFVKRFCMALKNFHVKNVCIITSGCNLKKNSAPT